MPDEIQIDPNAKGLPEGVTPADTGEGDRGAGAPKAPEISAHAPKVEPTAEELAASEAEKVKAAEVAAAEAKKAEDEELPPEVDEVLTEYPDYGDTNANAVVELLKEAKVTAEEAHALFATAVDTGDFSTVDHAKLVEKLGKAKADLVLLGVQSYYNVTTAKVQATVTAVHNEVGGEANYKKILTWARAKANTDKAFAEQASELNKMFDLGKTSAVIAGRELAKLYEKDAGNSSLVRKQITGDGAVTTSGSGGEYISRNDYLEKVKVAQAKGDTHEVARLRAQRTASRNN